MPQGHRQPSTTFRFLTFPLFARDFAVADSSFWHTAYEHLVMTTFRRVKLCYDLKGQEIAAFCGQERALHFFECAIHTLH